MTDKQKRTIAFITSALKIQYTGADTVADARAFISKHMAEANGVKVPANPMSLKQRDCIIWIEKTTGRKYTGENDMAKARAFIMKNRPAAEALICRA